MRYQLEYPEGYVKKIVKETIDKLAVKDNDYIRKLTIEENLEKVKDYEKIVHPRYFSPLVMNEGLIKSFPADNVISHMKDYFNFNDSDIWKIKVLNGQEKIVINVPNIFNNYKVVKEKMERCGWFLSAPTEKEIKQNQNRWIRMEFEAKFSDDATAKIKKKHKYLYHITPRYNLEKIKKEGLAPRCRNTYFMFPSRIYLLFPDEAKSIATNQKELAWLAGELCARNGSKGNDGQYSVLEIATDKLGDNVRLHYDPDYKYGLWTADNIKPDAIVGVSNIDFRKK